MYDYFEIQAKIGITKHMGGLEATQKLLKWCKVDNSDLVLVVAKGMGYQPLNSMNDWLNCIGIDLSEDMVIMAREKLKSSETGVKFVVGNAENLEFSDNRFDVIISESVTGFTDKTKSIPEYHRVLKHGGFLGLNEVTWISNPSREVDEYCRRVMGLMAETEDVWLSLLMESGFKDINSSVIE
jgi:ubiquinone/menaquinone biosynthesis C-methylase UbiE